MKLPQWLVICMLVVSTAVPCAAIAWWWVSWPEQTIRQFLALVEAEKDTEAMEMMDIRSPAFLTEIGYNFRLSDGTLGFLPRNWSFWFQGSTTELHSPELSDLICGRRRILPPKAAYEFIAERGKITLRPGGPTMGWTIVAEDDF